MANRSLDWLRQADADLRHARHARDAGDYDWSCFAAHQAAEKSVKAVVLAGAGEAWGHSVTRLLTLLHEEARVVPDTVLDASRLLDRHYIPTRYPDNLPDGAPTDYYRLQDADEAIRAAEVVLAYSRHPTR